jgi:hypothetical protein
VLLEEEEPTEEEEERALDRARKEVRRQQRTEYGTKSKIRLLLVAGWQNEFKFSSVFNRAK